MSTSIDFSDHESTVTVEREPTAVELAQRELIAKLEIRLLDLKSLKADLQEMLDHWKAEVSKQEDYVALGRYAVNNLQSEVDNLKARIWNLNDLAISGGTITNIVTSEEPDVQNAPIGVISCQL
ncbi:hypothetical protein HWV62_20880 [Athelia sp. TMB]|nr:hypothetical protein HWV62_20880 [Athelia sp. TMB]